MMLMPVQSDAVGTEGGGFSVVSSSLYEQYCPPVTALFNVGSSLLSGRGQHLKLRKVGIGVGVSKLSSHVPHFPFFFCGFLEHWHRVVDTLWHVLRTFLPLPCTAAQAFSALSQLLLLPSHRQVELVRQAFFFSESHSPRDPSTSAAKARTPRTARMLVLGSPNFQHR